MRTRARESFYCHVSTELVCKLHVTIAGCLLNTQMHGPHPGHLESELRGLNMD